LNSLHTFAYNSEKVQKFSISPNFRSKNMRFFQIFQTIRQSCPTIFLSLLITAPVMPQTTNAKFDAPTPQQQLLHEIYKQLIEINTTDSTGSTTEAAEAMAARLRAAGFPASDVQVLVHPDNPRKGNLVARLRSPHPTRKPLLLLAHLDVVEARKEDWSEGLDPFKLTERDGYFYGRGTSDDKAMAAIFVANLIRYQQENFQPDRDIILALTADEEGGNYNGVAWLVRNHRDLIDAAFGINEGGGGRERKGAPLFNGVQASEKVYQSFRLEVKNKGGHSSLPSKDNAIYTLAAGLTRLAQFDFPVDLNEVTRAYFKRMANIESGQTAIDMRAVADGANDAEAIKRLSASPYYNALMRTTCVATRLEAGHADNALPQTARATVNCRILPQESADAIYRTLVRVLADDKISVSFIAQPKPSPPSPLTDEVMQPIERITQAMWSNVPVIPIMGTGATDSLYLRQVGIPMYGVSGIFGDIDDNRAHGKDERVGVRQLYQGQEFLYRLVKELSKQ
jgi:acetylornithine deacetylase/succinyl-diaminopimelate desuccinylase-like protein